MQICNAVKNLEIMIVPCPCERVCGSEGLVKFISFDDAYVWFLIAFIFLEFAIILTLGVTSRLFWHQNRVPCLG